MAVEVKWDDSEQSIIRYEFRQPWDWKEFHQAVEQAWNWFNSTEQRIDTIVDFTGAGKMPIDSITQLSRTARSRVDPSRGMLVMVGVIGLLAAIGDVMERIFPKLIKNVHRVATVEEARLLIQQDRAAEQNETASNTI